MATTSIREGATARKLTVIPTSWGLAGRLALAELEGDAEKFAPLLDAFDGFVAQQQAYVPAQSE